MVKAFGVRRLAVGGSVIVLGVGLVLEKNVQRHILIDPRGGIAKP